MIQQMWEQSKWPIKDGIYLSDERVIPLDISVNWENWKIACPTISIRRLPVVMLNEIKEYQENRKTTLGKLYERSYPHLDLCCHSGECANGSEGFVALTKLNSGRLVWLAYFCDSNPFDEVEISDGDVVATNNHDHIWRFPLSAPDSFRVDTSNDVGWKVLQEAATVIDRRYSLKNNR